MKDTASNNVCRWILSTALLLHGDSEVAQGLIGVGLPEGEDQRHALTPGASLGIHTATLTAAHTASQPEGTTGMLLYTNHACEHFYVGPSLF